MPQREDDDRTKRECSLYLDKTVYEKLKGQAQSLDRSVSWLANSVLKEKLGLMGQGPGDDHDG